MGLKYHRGGVPRDRRLTKSLAFFAAGAAGFLLVLVSAVQNATPSPPPAPTHGVHTLTVTFDYEFRLTPACTASVTNNCVQEFVVYDISAGASKAKRYKLFTVPLPSNPNGIVDGIQATGPPLDFESGKDLLGVTALEPGANLSNESLPQACSTWITVPWGSSTPRKAMTARETPIRGLISAMSFTTRGNRGDSVVCQLSGQPTRATTRSDHANRL